MRWYVLVGAIATIVPINAAFAQEFPRHADICAGGIVSRPKLARAFLDQEASWRNLYKGSLEADEDNPPANRDRKPRWLRIFTETGAKFCAANPACLGPDPDAKPSSDPNVKPPLSAKVGIQIVTELQQAFRNALETNTRPGKSYRIDDADVGTAYFSDPGSRHEIICLSNEAPAMSKSPPGIQMPFRLRANSDDLNIDAQKQKDAFKGVKPATVTFTRDDIAKSSSTKMVATFGYPIALDSLALPLVKPKGLSSFTGELIPYLTAMQSVTKVDGKAATFADTNSYAAGALLNMQMTLDAIPGVDHFFMVKPQYLWNTKDKSEIASLRFIYQPWTDGRPPAINTPFPLTTVADGTWLQLLFDLRSDIGEYANVGTDPTKIAAHTSFSRAGTKFGFALTTSDKMGPHLTLNVTETLLYGFTGSVKQLSLFESTLMFYFDSTSNFALTLSYTNGRNEDTTEQSQTYTAGLSAKF